MASLRPGRGRERRAPQVLAKQRRGLYKFLQSKAKTLHISNVEMNAAAEPGQRLYERFMASWAFSRLKKMKLVPDAAPKSSRLGRPSPPPRNIHVVAAALPRPASTEDLHGRNLAGLSRNSSTKYPHDLSERPGSQPPWRI